MKIEAAVLRILILFLGVACGEGAELYVSLQGNDVNVGTLTQPLRSIKRAYSLASPGVTIIVLPGVYTEYTSGWGVHLSASGTASSPITLRSQVPGQAVIDGQNAADRNEAIYLDGNYNVIDGFEIKGGPNGGIAVYGSFNQIINNEIHHNGNPASADTNGKDGVYSDKNTHDNRYAGNYIHDNGRTGSNLDHGLYLCGDNDTVFNNVLIRNAATGLQVAGYTTVSNMRIYNNVVAFNGTSGIILWLALSGVDIKNNIVYRNGTYGFNSWDAHGIGVVLDRNINFGNVSGDYNFTSGASDYTYTQGTTIAAEPLFVNSTSATFDPHLRAGSPAIGAGANLSSVFSADKDGTARPASGGWAIGAFEYRGTTLPPLMTSLTFEAEAGLISGLFAVSAGSVSQGTNTTTPSAGGAARYRFNITQAGDYTIRALVNAPNSSSDSFFINIDAEPTDPGMIWDIAPSTTGFEERFVSWRGTGTFDAPEYSPRRFYLSAGEHTLVIRGREANAQIDRIIIEPFALSALTPPQSLRVIDSEL